MLSPIATRTCWKHSRSTFVYETRKIVIMSVLCLSGWGVGQNIVDFETIYGKLGICYGFVIGFMGLSMQMKNNEDYLDA